MAKHELIFVIGFFFIAGLLLGATLQGWHDMEKIDRIAKSSLARR